MPVPTVAEVLKQSGWSQEQIDALDAKDLSGLNSYVSNVYQTAEQKEQAAVAAAAKAEADRKAAEDSTAAMAKLKEDAEFANRNVQDFWATTYPTSLAEQNAAVQAAETARINAEALAEYYKKQNEGAREKGFVPADAPLFTPAAPIVAPSNGQTRGPDGKFIAPTPGTPTFTEDQVKQTIYNGLSNSVWALQEYQKLTGQFLPDSIDILTQEATQQKLPFRDYVARKYDFQGKQRAAQEAAAKAHDDSIRAARDAEKDAEYKVKLEAQAKDFEAKERKFAELQSTHPDMRQPVGSARITELRRASAEGERPDPTKMTPEARLKLTQDTMRNRLEERRQSQVA
jgi:hypothetical protein